MNRLGTTWCACLLMAFIGGCVSVPKYQEPTGTATADIQLPDAGDFTPIVFDDHECMQYDLDWVQRSGASTGSQVHLKATADVPLRLHFQHPDGSFECSISFAFVPEAGKSYIVVSNYTANHDGFPDPRLHRTSGECDVAVGYKDGDRLVPIKARKLELKYDSVGSQIMIQLRGQPRGCYRLK